MRQVNLVPTSCVHVREKGTQAYAIDVPRELALSAFPTSAEDDGTGPDHPGTGNATKNSLFLIDGMARSRCSASQDGLLLARRTRATREARSSRSPTAALLACLELGDELDIVVQRDSAAARSGGIEC